MKIARLFVLVTLCGCAAPALSNETSRSGPPAYVDLHRAFARAGYAEVAAAYGHDAVSLQQSEKVAAFDGMNAQFDAASQNVRNVARDAGTRVTAIQPRDARSVSPDAGAIRSVSVDTAAYARALDARAERARALRAQQARERQATVALDFERAHQQARLQLTLRLQNSAYLDPAERARLASRLHALDRQEAAAVAAQRRIDDADLARYAGQLRDQNARELAQMQDEAAAHARAVANVPKPAASSLPEAIRHPAYDSSAIARAFDGAAALIVNRFASLKGADAGARRSADGEIRRIAATKDALYEQAMQANRARAERVAASEHLGRVYFDAPPPGARDITDDL